MAVNRNKTTEIHDEIDRARSPKLTYKRNYSALARSPKHIVIGEPHLESGSLFDGDKLLSQDRDSNLRNATLQLTPSREYKRSSVFNLVSFDQRKLRNQATSMDTIESKEGQREEQFHGLASTSLMSIISRVELPQVYTKSNPGESDLTLPFLLKKFDEIRARYRDPDYPLPKSPAKFILKESIGDNDDKKADEQVLSTSTRFEVCHYNELSHERNQSFALKEPFLSVEDFDFGDTPTNRQSLRAFENGSVKPLAFKVRAERHSSSSEFESNENSNTGGLSSASQTAKDSMSSASDDLSFDFLGHKPGLLLPEATGYIDSGGAHTSLQDCRRYTPVGILIDKGELDGLTLTKELVESIRKRERIRNAGRLTGVPHFLPLNHA